MKFLSDAGVRLECMPPGFYEQLRLRALRHKAAELSRRPRHVTRETERIPSGQNADLGSIVDNPATRTKLAQIRAPSVAVSRRRP
jgi:hypothetical protein